MTTVEEALKMPPNHVEEGDGPIDIVGVASYNAGWNRCSDADQVKEKAIDEAMGGLTDVLGAPEYAGDYQTALIHHMGRAAFDGFDNIRHSVDVAKEIQELEPVEGVVPIILSYTSREDERRPQTMTAFVAVDPEQPFRSKVSHKADVQQRGLIEPVSVTTRQLSLVGPASIINANLANLDTHPYIDELRGAWSRSLDDEFVLRQTSQIDPLNRQQPQKLSPNTGVVIREHGYIREFDNFISPGPRRLIGWEAISERLIDYIPRGTGALKYIEQIVEFFEVANQLDALRRHSPDMAKSIDLAKEITAKFAELGSPAEVATN